MQKRSFKIGNEMNVGCKFLSYHSKKKMAVGLPAQRAMALFMASMSTWLCRTVTSSMKKKKKIEKKKKKLKKKHLKCKGMSTSRLFFFVSKYFQNIFKV